MCLNWIMVQLIRMVRTVKLSYTTVPQAIEVITQWRKAQSVVIRTAYNRVREGKKDKEILALLRAMPQGRLDSWLTLSALKRAHALHRANPERAVIFGGKHNLQLRAQGKITAAQWKAKRLLPLYFEGHAKSYGEQGGNQRFVLDIDPPLKFRHIPRLSFCHKQVAPWFGPYHATAKPKARIDWRASLKSDPYQLV